MEVDDALSADIARWMADARASEAAQARARERWLRQQATEDATFAGLLLSLQEREARATITLATGDVQSGRVVGVGADFAALSVDGAVTFVAIAAIASVSDTGARRTAAANDLRGPRSVTTLAHIASRIAAERPEIVIRAGGAVMAGLLVAVGEDVLTVEVERRPVYVPLSGVSSLSIGSSGV